MSITLIIIYALIGFLAIILLYRKGGLFDGKIEMALVFLFWPIILSSIIVINIIIIIEKITWKRKIRKYNRDRQNRISNSPFIIR